MKEVIEVMAFDEGQMGIRLDAETMPRGCPGLGGWKQDANGVWWTRVKGDACLPFVSLIEAGYHLIEMTLDGDRIVDVTA